MEDTVEAGGLRVAIVTVCVPCMTSMKVDVSILSNTVAVVSEAPNCEAGNTKSKIVPRTLFLDVIGWSFAVMICVAHPMHGTMY